MHRVTITAVFACVLTGLSAQGQVSSGNADEIGIRKVVQAYVDARNQRNAETTRSLFTEDADQLVSTGEWRKSADAVKKGTMASSRKEAPKSSIQVESIRLIDADVAIVDGRYQTVAAATGTTRNMWTTLVMKRTGTGWRIAAIRNMLPSP